MNRQAWRDFFITVFFLGIAFIIALFSSVAAEQRNTRLATIAAAVSLVLALLGALYIIPRLARNVRLEILRFAIRTTVTVEGLLFIVCLVVIGFAAWNTGNNLLYLILSAMMAFLIAANLIARISLADVSVQLRFPDHIYAGESANISVTLLNHKRLLPCYSVMIEAIAEEEVERSKSEKQVKQERRKSRKSEREAVPRNSREQARSEYTDPPVSAFPLFPPLPIGKLAYFVLIPAKQSARKRIERPFDQRGRYPITGFRISTKFPAGFFKKWRRIDATGEIIVYPKPKPLDDFYHALPMLAGQVQSHARGSGDDLYAIRRYQASDHMRNIDWKATAKSMQMMVREHTREDEWRLTIVFDTSAPAASIMRDSATGEENKARGRKPALEAEIEIGDQPVKSAAEAFQEKFERAIVMAASLANHFILERADVELITINDILNVSPGSGHDQLYKILRSLATLQPTANPSDEREGRGARKAGKLKEKAGKLKEDDSAQAGRQPDSGKQGGNIAWRLLEVPVLSDDRRFKVLITSAANGTIPAHVWRSAHVVFMDDL